MSEPGSEAATDRKKLLARAGIVGAGTLASRVLGLFRDMALAAMFSRAATDAFFVAFTIPNALRQLLGEGAVSSAVVPVLTAKMATEGDEAARTFFRKIRGVSLLALLAVTLLGMAAATPLARLFAGGESPEELARTASLTRAVFPYIFFMGTAALGMAALHAKRKFAVASFAPGLLNVAFLVTAFTLPGPLVALGIDPAQAIVAGAVLGGALQVVAQMPALRAIGFLSPPDLDFRDPAVRDVLRRMGPMTLGIGVYYIDLVISRRFLSELGPGAQSYFSWAMRLCDFPQGIFVMAISTAGLPSLAAAAARKELDEVRAIYAHGMRLSLFVALPASVLLAVLGEPLVVALFQRGQFDAAAAHETAKALAFQGGAIWTVAAVRQIVPVFYALGDTRTPVLVSALDLLAFVALAFGLTPRLGHVGVSVAVAGSSAVQMLLLWAALSKRIGPLRGMAVAGSAARTLSASLVAALAGWGTATIAARAFGMGALRAIPGLMGAVVFGAVFVVAAFGLGSAELDEVGDGLRRKLAPRRG